MTALISGADTTRSRLDDVLARARERCQMATTAGVSESQTPNCSGGAPNPTKLTSIYDCIEKSIGYGLEPPVFGGTARPPMETYTTTATEGGTIYRATDEYVLWYRNTYGLDKTPDRGVPRPTRRAPQEVGGIPDL